MASAQIADQNVNMVAGTQWPGGDPFLQRQNEPSIAVSTRNPLHLLGGANDYRTVDLPGLPNGDETGDAWLGVFKSRNGGQTWWSTLLPGYPQDAGSSSPLKGFQAAADPVVRAGANGMFYYSGIVLNRDATNPPSSVFVARFIDNNNTENGDPIGYLGTNVVDRGSSGQFIDKPWVAVAPGTGTCTVAGQTFASQNVYLAYTIFLGTGNNQHTKIMFARSTDCGATWSPTQKLNDGSTIEQGATIAVAPSGTVYVAWRRFKSATDTDAIFVSKSTDQGRTFSKPALVANIHPFEQGMTYYSIRTNAYPAMATDDGGNVYIAWSERSLDAVGTGRVVITSSANGSSWTTPVFVDPASTRGHQFMPTMAFAGGKLVVAYYDLRDDSTRGEFTALGGGQYLETRANVGDLAAGHPESVFTQYLLDQAHHRRHTLDLRAAEANAALVPLFNGFARVSRYVFGSRPSDTLIEQLQFNPPNLPMFKLGTAPFLGDYIDLAPAPSKGAPVFHAVWTDNRDVRPPVDGNWANYTPPNSAAKTASSRMTGQAVPQCVAGQTGMRNQNIYTARITEGLFAASPGNAKQLVDKFGKPLQRAFAVYVQNATTQKPGKTFRLTVHQPLPAGTVGSFSQFDATQTQIDVFIQPHSSATRTLYVSSTTNAHASVTVDITEVAGGVVVPGGLTTSVVINPDVSNPDVSNPDVSNPDVSNPDVSNPDVSNPDVSNAEVHNPDVSNPDVSNPDVSNPDVSNPDVSNPDVSNPDVSNPDVSNPDVSNPDVSNPDVSNPDVSNPDVSNPDVSNGSVSDTTWTTHNTGNTTSGFTVKLATTTPIPQGVKTQLIINRIYQTPVGHVGPDGKPTCDLGVLNHREILANIVNPKFTTLGELTTADPADATLYLAPGDAARITLRVFAPLGTPFEPASAITPVVVAQAVNTQDVANGITVPPMSLTITTSSLATGTAGRPYSATMQAVGGVGAKQWSIEKGPSWLSIDPSTGVLSGTPTSAASSFVTFAVADSAIPAHTATRTLTLNVLGGTATPGTAAAGFGQLVVIQGAAFPLASGMTAAFTDGSTTQNGFIFTSPSSASALYVRLPFVGDGSTTANLANGPVSVAVSANGSPVTTAALTVSTTPGAPVIQAVYPTVFVPGNNACSYSVASTPITEIASGIPIGVSAFGIDTVGSVLRFEQNGAVVADVNGTCPNSYSTIGLAPIFSVPQLQDGTATIRMRTTVNGVASDWSAPVTVTVKNLVIL